MLFQWFESNFEKALIEVCYIKYIISEIWSRLWRIQSALNVHFIMVIPQCSLVSRCISQTYANIIALVFAYNPLCIQASSLFRILKETCSLNLGNLYLHALALYLVHSCASIFSYTRSFHYYREKMLCFNRSVIQREYSILKKYKISNSPFPASNFLC